MLVLIFLAGAALRLFGIDWDSGFHLHPDERMLVMVAQRIQFFSHLNPQFFNYGSLPIYLLAGISQLIGYATYDNQLYIGRYISIIADLGTLGLVYALSLRLWKQKHAALWAAAVYATAIFPIQNSHFFVVDPLLTFFSTLLIYLLIRYQHNKTSSMKLVFGIGATCAAVITTKFTGILFLPFAAILIGSKNRQHLAALAMSTLLGSFLFMPYAFISYRQFLADISLQLRMNGDAYIFPYTLQYVGTLPYLYPLQQLFLWGFGPIYTVLAAIGIWISARNRKQWLVLLIIALYVVIIGKSAVKFMRYLLPLYPLLAIYAGYTLFRLKRVGIPLFAASCIFTLLFMRIYLEPNTRVQATRWILTTIPAGSTIAVEHWDDRLPLTGSERYRMIELPLYNLPDDEKKWLQIDSQLRQSDYIVIASNRLYAPLQKLYDCTRYRACYPRTARYYRQLFTQKRGFTLIKSFQASNPRGSTPGVVGGLLQPDESFTVYDHPIVYIFEKQSLHKALGD